MWQDTWLAWSWNVGSTPTHHTKKNSKKPLDKWLKM